MDSISDFLKSLLTAQDGMGALQVLTSLGVAYLGGVLSSLTPCVYPMIPITVSVVGGMGHSKRSWSEVLLRGSAYVAGMTVIYSFLGVLAGITGKVFGSFTNTSGWYLGLGIVMTFAALVMLEVIHFDPLVWWGSLKRKLGFKASKTVAAPVQEMTFFGAFALGASSGFIAAPCTTPVLTAILTYIAETKSVGLGMGLMVAFSIGLGTLLLVIALFAGAIQVLPRSGNWMNTVKLSSGILLLAFAGYLIYRAGALGGI
jgi:cytochrome c-type biogenesis protein